MPSGIKPGVHEIRCVKKSLKRRNLLKIRVNEMARECQVTGKKPVSGNNVSHAHNKTRRRFLPNVHDHRFWLESENRFIKLRVSAKGMRIIDKKGIEQVVADMRANGQRI